MIAYIKRRALTGAIVASLVAGTAVWQADAAGPLLLFAGKPIRWPNHDVGGGPLDSTTVTVDANGTRTIFYRVDTGPLGPLSNADAVRIVDRVFAEFSSIPTANIRFVNAGPILDPDTRTPMDVDASNVGKLLHQFDPTFQNPIIFDTDGSILGLGGTVALAGPIAFSEDGGAVVDATVVLNGRTFSDPAVSLSWLIGVVTHEAGHFAGPLDHAQINGGIASSAARAAVPDGFSRVEAYDLFAPFVETMHPFLTRSPAGSTLGFLNDGPFMATLDRDTRNALSNLYPNALYQQTTGSIEGQVFFRDRGDRIVVDGMNVVARRISAGAYPPPVGTAAFSTPPAVDADGVPDSPPAQDVTDSLATVSSAVTGLEFGRGTYRIQGLLSGLYEVILQGIESRAIGGSRIGPLEFQLALPHAETYFRGPKGSADVSAFTPVVVVPSVVHQQVDFEVTGFTPTPPQADEEAGVHPTIGSAQDLATLPVRVEGAAADTDPAGVFINFGDGLFGPVQDVYKFQTTASSTLVWISLEALEETADLDLYLLRSNAKGIVPLSQVPRYSVSVTGHELIGEWLGPNTWYIGVSAATGETRYKLRVMAQTP